jgi:gamma-glutamyltranspeptidase/glutathione hydrolase
MECSATDLLDPDYLAARAATIDPNRAQDFGPGNPPRAAPSIFAPPTSAG